MGKYDYGPKKAYSNSGLVARYDLDRFSSPAGKLIGSIEEDIVLASIPIKELADGNKIILDMCTGTGRFAVECAKLRLNVIGCDASLPMLRTALQKAATLNLSRNTDFVSGDIYNLPFKDGKFSHVICIRLINQLQGKDSKERAIKELCRVCGEGGTFLFDFVNASSISLVRGRLHRSRLVSFADIEKIVSAIPGVRIKSFTGRFIISQTILMHIPRYLLKIMTKLDAALSRLFYGYAIKGYVVIERSRKS